jgi:cholesterol transport system auxiliary component
MSGPTIRMIRRSACLAAAVLTGCGILMPQPPEPTRYYVLEPRPCPDQTRKRDARGTIALENATSANLVDPTHIVFSEAPGSRGRYQFAAWASPVGEQWTMLLVRRLECAALFSTVSRGYHPTASDFMLVTELVSLVHDTSTPPGTATVEVRAELSSTARGSRLHARTFTSSREVPSFDAAGAVAGFDAAIGNVLDELLGWVEQTTQ